MVVKNIQGVYGHMKKLNYLLMITGFSKLGIERHCAASSK